MDLGAEHPEDDRDDAVIADAVAGRDDDQLAGGLGAMRDELTAPPTAQTRWNHVAAMRRAVVPTRSRGSRAMVAVAAATVGVVALTSGLAAAGKLPDAAQDRVARIVEVVGVDIPGNDEAVDEPRTRDRSTPAADPGSARRGNPDLPSTAPGVADTNPGAAGTPPGRSGTAPGLSPTSPGSSGSAPGQTGSTPGQSGSNPGQSGSNPGQSGSNPGKSGGSPGSSGNAPGHTDEAPGSSGDAPGHTKRESLGAPGRSGSAPGQANQVPAIGPTSTTAPASAG